MRPVSSDTCQAPPGSAALRSLAPAQRRARSLPNSVVSQLREHLLDRIDVNVVRIIYVFARP